ncbi:serine protease inhibitor dipetalogastin-like [Mizuhopecten yessoensis]|uniref:Four-domain proteases inhibitor n=1 Tax=Mizuhopecten yessoensis TaxID=6573 RepID=A0A210QVK8_MIZYE|nr:serine protease inhibitor dipetalogastin-like [Mizuhopecten yessoensis]OWF52745.1 Four-domain proteases inhibitor [Mizuhopecten yessoensis]
MYTLAVFVTVLGAVYGQSHLCDRICNSQYSPVCGTDRHTYSNMCKLQIAECYARLKGQHMTLAHTGSCRSISTQPHSTHCDTICDDESGDSAVCGSDGITYDSHCDFENARCLAARQHGLLSIRHTGQCTQTDLNCPVHCDTKEISPVCTIGNHTYRSMCFLKQLQCRYVHIASIAERYEFAHNGSCDGLDITKTYQMDCSPYQLNGQIAVEGGHQDILLKTCDRTYNPICGTDLRTHTNLCSYCHGIAMQHKLGTNLTVSVIAETVCPSYLSSHIVVG